MPNNMVKSFAKKLKKSEAAVEKVWKDAKAQAKKQGKANNFALITHIFKSMLGIDTEKKEEKTQMRRFKENEVELDGELSDDVETESAEQIISASPFNVSDSIDTIEAARTILATLAVKLPFNLEADSLEKIWQYIESNNISISEEVDYDADYDEVASFLADEEYEDDDDLEDEEDDESETEDEVSYEEASKKNIKKKMREAKKAKKSLKENGASLYKRKFKQEVTEKKKIKEAVDPDTSRAILKQMLNLQSAIVNFKQGVSQVLSHDAEYSTYDTDITKGLLKYIDQAGIANFGSSDFISSTDLQNKIEAIIENRNSK